MVEQRVVIAFISGPVQCTRMAQDIDPVLYIQSNGSVDGCAEEEEVSGYRFNESIQLGDRTKTVTIKTPASTALPPTIQPFRKILCKGDYPQWSLPIILQIPL